MKHTFLVRALVDKVGSQMAAAKLVGVSQPTIRSWMMGSDIFGQNEVKLLAAAKKLGVKVSKDLVGGLDVTQVKGIDPRNGALTDKSTAFWVIPTAYLRWQMRSDPNKVAVAEVTVANEGFQQGDVVIVDTSVKEGDGIYLFFVDGNLRVKVATLSFTFGLHADATIMADASFAPTLAADKPLPAIVRSPATDRLLSCCVTAPRETPSDFDITKTNSLGDAIIPCTPCA